MKAIILAAGYGNRMRPLTDSKHKTLLEVGGRTIIGRIIDALLDRGVLEIVVVTGYRDEELTGYCTGHYPDVRFQFVHNPRFGETNNIYSMALAFDSIEISSDILLIESDLIFDPVVLDRLMDSPYPNVALVDHFRSGMDGTVVTVDDGIVTSVIPPHLQPENFDFSDKFKTLNIYKFSQQFCETSFKKLLMHYANAIDDNCYYELILGILIYMQKETIHAEVLQGEKWAEVDDPNDLHVADFVFNQDRKRILEDSFGGFWNYDVLDFNFIRNMHFPNAAIISEMRNNLANLVHNYGSRQVHLDTKLSWFLLCKRERVIALNGASQCYPTLGRMFGAGTVLVPAPTFGEYRRVFPNTLSYADEVGISTDEIEKKCGGVQTVVVVNPNNPTGSTVPSEWITDFALRHLDKTVIVDESFVEFSGQRAVVELLEERPADNILVVKSLSKSLGVPGLRLGYMYSCSKHLLERVRGDVPIWNMNSLAEFFLETILKHRRALQASFDQTIRDRERFAADLSALAAVERVYPSGANFLLVSLRDPARAEAISQKLLEQRSIFVRDISAKFSSGKQYLRIAVRRPEENRELVACLRDAGACSAARA